MLRDHFRHLASYNEWANNRLYDAAASLSEEDYYADRGAFFRSVHGTLNHLLVIDLLWCGRIAPPAFQPTGYDMILEDTLQSLRKRRQATDTRLCSMMDGLDEEALSREFSWVTLEGTPRTAPLSKILTQVFNHQTHHRGQAHTLLSQAGQDPPPLDFYWVMFDPPPSVMSSGPVARRAILGKPSYVARERENDMNNLPVAARVTHHFRASPERVFDAWLDPDMIGRFMFGPHLRDEQIVRLSSDPRIGGKFSFVVRRQGEEIDHVGEYLELDRPRRLVFTWAVADDADDSRVVIDIEPAELGSELTLTHEMQEKWADFVPRAREAWSKMLNALAEVLN
jgi:uncharacterized damage-inducible protein DinB/uncharacterized protein YndB with AHSA1/START domain